jgi:hypothetical protein
MQSNQVHPEQAIENQASLGTNLRAQINKIDDGASNLSELSFTDSDVSLNTLEAL